MKRPAVVILFLLASFVVSCATTVNYPITLSYRPLMQHEKTGGLPITVAMLDDKRQVADKRVIGGKEGDAPFITLIEEPAAAISKGIAANLEERGYAVKMVNEVWDGDTKSLKEEWGNYVIGGTLDNIALDVKQTLIKTRYECAVKYTLLVADTKTRELLHNEKFEVTSSYVTFPFSREKAEELINKVLSDAIERGLADIGKYLKAKEEKMEFPAPESTKGKQ